MDLFPSPTRRCLLPSLPFYVWCKSTFFLYRIKEKHHCGPLLIWKEFVAFFPPLLFFDWAIPCICHDGLISLICVLPGPGPEHSSMFIIRTGRCYFASSPPLLSTSWDLLEPSLTWHAWGPWPRTVDLGDLCPHHYVQGNLSTKARKCDVLLNAVWFGGQRMLHYIKYSSVFEINEFQ